MSFDALMSAYRARVEQALINCLPAPALLPARLHEAMRYAVLGGGKRVRAILVYATGDALNAPPEALDAAACAVELVHAYSLVYDDMPAMDNDDLRRGKPTCHKAFGEAVALLAGDALHSLAFHTLAHQRDGDVSATRRLKAVETLAHAIGSRGMAGGQAIDLGAVDREMSLTDLETMHIHKTGALIRASVMLGALSGPDADPAVLEGLDHYAKRLGLAFQICDDILDVEGDTTTLGKTAGADSALNKPTYPSIVGMTRAKEMARELHDEAVLSLAPLGPKGALLCAFADWLVTRKN